MDHDTILFNYQRVLFFEGLRETNISANLNNVLLLYVENIQLISM